MYVLFRWSAFVWFTPEHHGRGQGPRITRAQAISTFGAYCSLDHHPRTVVADLQCPILCSLTSDGSKVVHLLGHGYVEDDDEAPFRVVSGGGSDLARISCSLRHDTAYKPHEVRLSRLRV